MTEFETVRVSSDPVHCDGGGGALGHPLVFLRIGAAGEVVCPYCSRRFVLENHEKDETAGSEA